MRAALLRGAAVAAAHGDSARQALYEEAAQERVVDPWPGHTLSASGAMPGALGECPSTEPSQACVEQGKALDSVVFLALVHAGDAATTAVDPVSVTVARTVDAYNEAFCNAYPINNKGLPGIVYGRYLKDAYGSGSRGNPWVLLTAALANVLYRAGRSAAASPPSQPAIDAWRVTFGPDFGTDGAGLPTAFVAAGDSVLRRLRMHVAPEDEDHLYEQIDRTSGHQYNAKDLTWSYAETLAALQQRRQALSAIKHA